MKRQIERLVNRILGMTPGEIVQSRQARGMGGSLTVRMGDRFFRFVMAVLLARIMGPEQFGVYVYVLSWVTMMAMPGVLGTPQFTQREIAIAEARRDSGAIRGMVQWSTLLVVVMSILVMGGGYLAVDVLGSSGNGLEDVFRIALPLVPLVSLIRLWQGNLRGLGHVIQGQIPELTLRPVLFVLFIVLAWIWLPQWHLNARHAFTLLIPAVFASTLLAGILLIRHLKKHAAKRPAYNFRQWIRQSSRFTLLTGLSMLNARIGILMVGAIASPRDAGIFTVAVRGSELIVVASMAAHTALGPRMAALFEQDKLLRLQQMIRRGYRGIALLTFPVFLLFLFFGDKLLLVFGRGYDEALIPLVLLVVGQFVGVLCGPNGVLLNNTRHERASMMGIGLSVLVTGALNMLLIPQYGATGAAIGALAGVMTWNVLLTGMALRKVGIWTPILGRFPGNLQDHPASASSQDMKP